MTTRVRVMTHTFHVTVTVTVVWCVLWLQSRKLVKVVCGSDVWEGPWQSLRLLTPSAALDALEVGRVFTHSSHVRSDSI